MFRLVAYAPDGVRRYPVHRRRMVLGSEPECDVYLPYTGVAQRHAEVLADGEELTLVDLGSRRGTLVSGQRVREARLAVLDEIRVGAVTLLVEDVQPEREASAAEPVEEGAAEAPPRITAQRMIDHLGKVAEWVLTDIESRVASESLLRQVLADFGGGLMILLHGGVVSGGIKLMVANDDAWLGHAEELAAQVRARVGGDEAEPGTAGSFEGELAGERAWIAYHFFRAVGRSYSQAVAFPRYRPTPGDTTWDPVPALGALGDLAILGLVHHVGAYEPILPGQRSRPDLTLAPGLIVGESQAMQRLLDLLRELIDTPHALLLRGEAGVGKELLARSLHNSSRRRERPMVVATASGATPVQLEADLFGAEIPGREGPVRREGKLLLADGGTLFLDDVDLLPLELQARLVRFLRSGEVEPAGSREARKVDVRLIAASRGALEEAVVRDRFRVDLAYRLSQVSLDVPPLRERREDLPLLLQAAINRACHESGRRMQGITVKAISALLAYDYPGNLSELENVARQLVQLCPPGQPVDVNLLPEHVRRSSIDRSTKVDATSDLDLERLVAAAERSAIREALKRAGGNKSQAARLLGLSRNGLATKMDRYALGSFNP